MPDDLIPRSKAIEAIKAAKEKGNIYCTLDPEKKPEKTPHAFVILRKALDAIDAIPAAPMKHGKWEKSIFAEDFHRCSICASVWNRKFEYCPHCGAKMDEEDHHEID